MCERLAEMLSQEGLVLESLRPRDYPPSGALGEIARRLVGCAGVVVAAFGTSTQTNTTQRKRALPHGPTSKQGWLSARDYRY